MSLFRRPDYHSEATQFIDKLKSARPKLEAQQRETLVLPRGAYLTDSAGQYVYLLDSKTATARKQAVTLGKQSANQIEVVSGLRAGDQVIISGYRDFAQADTIQLQQ